MSDTELATPYQQIIQVYRTGYDSGVLAGQKDIGDRYAPIVENLQLQVGALLAEKAGLVTTLQVMAPDGPHFDLETIIDGRYYAMRQLFYALGVVKAKREGDVKTYMELVQQVPAARGLAGNDLIYATMFLSALVVEAIGVLSANDEHGQEALLEALDRVDEHVVTVESYLEAHPDEKDSLDGLEAESDGAEVISEDTSGS